MESKSTKGAEPVAADAGAPSSAKPQQFTVRAIPAPGHTHRRRAGRAWGKDKAIVTVVDAPRPPRNEKDRDGKTVVIYSDEISPDELAMLQADPHLAVVPHRVSGAEASDALEIAELKIKLSKLEGELAAKHKDLQDAAELLKIERAGSRQGAEEAGGRIVQLEGELQTMRGQLSKRQGKGE